jgi:hypothetical protein
MNLIITFFVFIEKLDMILNLLEMFTKIVPVLSTIMNKSTGHSASAKEV